MDTQGLFAPTTYDEARDRYETIGPAAQTVVKETAKAMSFDTAEYDERVTGDVVETARDALFASLLAVSTGSREEFDAWLDDETYDDADVTVFGSDNVDHVAWHAAPDRVVAATFQSEPDAAVATLRRQAYGRVYADQL